MKDKKDIDNFNTKNQLHGYQEWYDRGKLWYRGIYKHGLKINYSEQNGYCGNGIGQYGTKVIFNII